MSSRNCINCGAPFDIDLHKCPYCGTSYFDMSCLDLESGEPFALKIKTNMNGKTCYITQMVRPRNEMSIDFSSDTVDVYSSMGRLMSYTVNRSVTTNLSFEAINLPNQKELMRIEVED